MGDTAQMENIFRYAALAQDSFPLAQHDAGQAQHHAMIKSCQRLQSLSGYCGAVKLGRRDSAFRLSAVVTGNPMLTAAAYFVRSCRSL